MQLRPGGDSSPAVAQSQPDSSPSPAVLQMRLGARVRALRDERGLTQADLAHVSGMDRSQLAAVEAGRRNVTLANLARLSRALGVTLSHLLDGVDG